MEAGDEELRREFLVNNSNPALGSREKKRHERFVYCHCQLLTLYNVGSRYMCVWDLYGAILAVEKWGSRRKTCLNGNLFNTSKMEWLGI